MPYSLPLTGSGTGTLAALTPGIISTVVGGAEGQSVGLIGADGPATAAHVGSTSGFAIDSLGHMYLADQQNEVIWNTDTSNNVHLYAGAAPTPPIDHIYQQGMYGDGEPANNSTLGFVGPLALDAKGGLYVGYAYTSYSYSESHIRYIDPVTHVINTVAGYVQPYSWVSNSVYDDGARVQIKLDGTLYLYVATPGGASGMSSPVWPMTKGASVSDGTITWVNQGVYTATNGCAAETDLLGDGCLAQDATLGVIEGMALDANGNLFFSDGVITTFDSSGQINTPHSMIRRIDALTGIVTVVAGTSSPGSSGDGGPATLAEITATDLALDSHGNVYFVDSANGVRKVDMSSGIISTITGGGILGFPSNGCLPVTPDGSAGRDADYYSLTGIAFDAADNLYLADQFGCVVRRIDSGTQTIHTVAGAPGAGFPLYNTGYGDLGQIGSDGSALEAELSLPELVKIDSLANIDIASFYGGVRKVDVSQSVLPFAGPYLQRDYTQQPLTVSAPLTATVINAGNSGSLIFSSPFISPSWGIYDSDFIRDVTDPTGIADCYDLESIPSGFECPINVDFAPQTSSPNFVSAQNTINDNAPNTPQVIQLSGLGLGAPPAVTLEPSLVSIFTAQSSKSSPQPVTLANNGESPLPISAITITGTGANAYSQTNNCGAELAPNSACTILVTFSPPYLGTTNPPDNLKATLSVTDIADNSPQTSQLVGVGTASVPTPLVILETISLSDTDTEAPAQQLSIQEIIDTSDGTPTTAPAKQLAIQEIIDTSDGTPATAPIQQLAITETIRTDDAPAVISGSSQTTVNLVASALQLLYGVQETFTVTIAPATATGTVAFYDAGTLLGSSPVSSGVAIFTTSALAPGTHTIQANYAGDSSDLPAVSGSLQILVQAVLTVAVQNLQLPVGSHNRSFSYVPTGFVGTDNASVLNGNPAYATTASPNSPAGSYPITATVGTLTGPSYYLFNFVPGTLTILGGVAQVITFHPFPQPIGLSTFPGHTATFTLTATSNSGGLGAPITYQVTGPATILAGNILSITGPGTVKVTASEAGNATFNAAQPVAQSIEVLQ